jgi:hypothetical protein
LGDSVEVDATATARRPRRSGTATEDLASEAEGEEEGRARREKVEERVVEAIATFWELRSRRD